MVDRWVVDYWVVGYWVVGYWVVGYWVVGYWVVEGRAGRVRPSARVPVTPPAGTFLNHLEVAERAAAGDPDQRTPAGRRGGEDLALAEHGVALVDHGGVLADDQHDLATERRRLDQHL